ncbi:MAG: ABC transporter permease [bacterium]
MSAIAIIVKRDMLCYMRDKSYFISSVFRPILWLIVIGFGIGSVFQTGGMDWRKFIFPGMIGMAIIFTSVFFGMSIIWDRQFGFLKVILVAPVPRVYVVLGKMVSGSIISTVQGAFVLMLAPLLNVPLSLPKVLFTIVLMFIGSMALTALGIFIASRMESFEGFGMIMNFVLMPMFFLSGALFPIDKVPKAMYWIVMLNPVTYCVDALQYALLADLNSNIVFDAIDFPIIFNVIIIITFTILIALLAGANFSRNK